ncbi:MAG: hypothetical protein IJS65_06600 [Clostridia bacterium]|nr:hypothetical protein [Clostridia bacterium]
MNTSKKLYVIELQNFSVLSNNDKIYCSTYNDIINIKKSLGYMAQLVPFEMISTAFNDFISEESNKEKVYFTTKGSMTIKTVTDKPFILTFKKEMETVLTASFAFPEEISEVIAGYSNELFGCPFTVDEISDTYRSLINGLGSGFSRCVSLDRKWSYELKVR